ncbi:hypothetical protein [Paracoccus beibuensis]|uniref:hypothetical protein n=1 Tax=Paracoccus beibuensis TaxID=547602 RepID=UPI0022406D36|nr:hypothetical protein [Paracoccus beibuensis]
MSHNHEPERAAPRHKPAIIAIIFVLAVALVAFLVFTPGADENNDGIATTEPPAGTTVTEAEGTELGEGAPVVSDAETPAANTQSPVGAADLPAGAEPTQPGSPEGPVEEVAPAN